MTEHSQLLNTPGYNKLNRNQQDVIRRCIEKGSGGLSAGIGFGKTITAMVLALYLNQCYSDGISLIVMNKTLLGNWIHEWEKFYGDQHQDNRPEYQVFHSDAIKDIEKFTIKPSTKFIFTTGEALVKIYTKNHMEDKFIYKVRHDSLNDVTMYNSPNEPFLEKNSVGTKMFYSIKWSCVIIDEVQRFCNILTRKCCSVASLAAYHRWALSGTMFDEPKIEKILGYYTLINEPSFPRNIPDAQDVCKKGPFVGLQASMIIPTSHDPNPPLLPAVQYKIISHDLREEEEIIYATMKQNMMTINRSIQASVNQVQKRKFASYLLALLIYLRQCIVSPLIPIASACLDTYDITNGSYLSRMMSTSFLSIESVKRYIENPSNVISSRIEKVLEILATHPDEKVIVFTTFRSCLNLMQTVVEKETKRSCRTITSSMNSTKRQDVVDEFNTTELPSVLFLTYDIGAEGLNLQTCKTMILVDLYWNKCKADQAIGRIVRQGQTAKAVTVYFMTSNTAIEEAVYDKQFDKWTLVNELLHGPTPSIVKTITISDIIRFIEIEENISKMKRLHG